MVPGMASLTGLTVFLHKASRKGTCCAHACDSCWNKREAEETLSASSSRRGLFSPRTGCCLLVKQQGLAMWLEGCSDVQTNGCMDFSGSPVCSCSLFPRDPTADPSLKNSANKGLGGGIPVTNIPGHGYQRSHCVRQSLGFD